MSKHHCRKKNQFWTAFPTKFTLFTAIVTFSISTFAVSAFLLWISTTSPSSTESIKHPHPYKEHWVKTKAVHEKTTVFDVQGSQELLAVGADENLKTIKKMNVMKHGKKKHAITKLTISSSNANNFKQFQQRSLATKSYCVNIANNSNENDINEYERNISGSVTEGHNKRYMKWKFINSQTVERKARFQNYRMKKRLLLYPHSQLKNKWIYYRRDFNNELENILVKNSSKEFEVNDESIQEFLTHEVPSRTTVIKWCPIFKAASSPWMAIFAKLRGALTPLTEKKIVQGRMSFVKLNKDFRINVPILVVRSNSQSSYSMVVVRHPFERILSAYRDKIERIKGREFYHKKYGASIIYRFRRPAQSSLFNFLTQSEDLPLKDENGIVVEDGIVTSSTTTPQPEDLMLKRLYVNGVRLVNHHDHFPSALGDAHGDLKASLPVPTFDEFIQYLLSVPPTRMDEHWRPMYIDCSPCYYNFDFILKVETMAEDRDKILRLLGYHKGSKQYQELIAAWKRWQNKVIPSPYNRNKTSLNYFSQISKSRLMKLYDIYEHDFKLFNYSAEEYFMMASSS